jgi:hypothetical protein
MMRLLKVVILRESFKVCLQKACAFSLGEPRGTRRSRAHAQTVLYYIEVSTLNARLTCLGNNKTSSMLQQSATSCRNHNGLTQKMSGALEAQR